MHDVIDTSAPPVRLFTSSAPGQMVGFVTLPDDGEVRVRFNRSNGDRQWRCDRCGAHRFSTCRHEVAMRDAIRGQKRGESNG